MFLAVILYPAVLCYTIKLQRVQRQTYVDAICTDKDKATVVGGHTQTIRNIFKFWFGFGLSVSSGFFFMAFSADKDMGIDIWWVCCVWWENFLKSDFFLWMWIQYVNRITQKVRGRRGVCTYDWFEKYFLLLVSLGGFWEKILSYNF